MTLIKELITSIQKNKQTIVFPEAIDERVLGAASRLHSEEILTPVLIGNRQEIEKTAEENDLDIERITSIDPDDYEEIDAMVDAFVERRNGKVDAEEARALQAEFLALEGLSQLLTTVREVRAGPNRALAVDGVVITMADSRNRLSTQVETDARDTLGPMVYATVVPRNVRLSEAPSHGMSVLRYDPNSRGSQAYRALAQEFLSRHRKGGRHGDQT